MSDAQVPNGREYTQFEIRYSNGYSETYTYDAAPEPRLKLAKNAERIDWNAREIDPHMSAALNACLSYAASKCPIPGSYRIYHHNPYVAIAGGYCHDHATKS